MTLVGLIESQYMQKCLWDERAINQDRFKFDEKSKISNPIRNQRGASASFRFSSQSSKNQATIKQLRNLSHVS